MTTSDHDSPLDDGPVDDDTLAVNAVVDDEATAEQRRRVARDPALVARVAALREAVAAVAAPVEPPSAAVLDALRARALVALDEPETDDEAAAAEEASPYGPPPADLGAARARRAPRRLPPLPAVAAVIVLLVLVGVGLLVTGSSDGDQDQATSSAANAGDAGGEEAGTGSGGGDDEGDAAAGSAAEELEEGFSERPADEVRDELLGRATARFASEEDLTRELQRVDPEGLGLTGSTTQAADGGSGSTTTTAPAPTTAGSGGTDAQARSFAADEVATRCDDVLRAAEPELEPAIAAALVDVAGVPVLVLTSPVEVSDDAPSGLRLTVLNAVDCSPRAAVLR